MTMQIKIKDEYLKEFDDFINSLPDDAIKIKKSLDEEIQDRIDKYKKDSSSILPLSSLDDIKKDLVARFEN